MDQSPSSSDPMLERVLLVGVSPARGADREQQDALDELGRLVKTAGAAEAGRLLLRLQRPHPACYIGKGQAAELADQVRDLGADSVVFDEDLTPAQARNLENIIGTKVVDRTQVILDIFARHARTREGKLQVELARTQYLLPRLRRMWTHLERQRGGIGVRGGPGEQQIEVDRRRVEQRLAHLRSELKQVGRRRSEQRRGRRRQGWALVSLVGYTNAGKSSLLNRLTGARVPAQDQLFVTLDPTTRKVDLPNHQPVLLTDTVGFIRKLPHHLVEAFKASLEEVVEADLLVHVIDASQTDVENQVAAVQAVLQDLGAGDKPVLAVLNKIDVEGAAARARALSRTFPRAVLLSAATGEGFDGLLAELADGLRDRTIQVRLRIPLHEGRLLASLHASGPVLQEVGDEEAVTLDIRLPRDLAASCARFRIDAGATGATSGLPSA